MISSSSKPEHLGETQLQNKILQEGLVIAQSSVGFTKQYWNKRVGGLEGDLVVIEVMGLEARIEHKTSSSPPSSLSLSHPGHEVSSLFHHALPSMMFYLTKVQKHQGQVTMA